jgi:3'5'-cyclic nucleotide phosphodiesterase
VSNKTLVKEKSRLARIFNNKCVAEQNSFQCAWDLLNDPSFDSLREAIFTTKEERDHFRQLVINSIVATDLMDKELNEARSQRWEMAFSRAANKEESPGNEPAPESSVTSPKDLRDRQATVLLEYLVQASDVAHTMQHWNVYRKWNERLFYENMKAFNAGRLDENPCDFWYDAELEFFDNTIIPMVKKLKSSGAFGVVFDEHLSYATQNRHEWQRKGKEIVLEMEQAFEALGIGGFSERGDLSDFDASGRFDTPSETFKADTR